MIMQQPAISSMHQDQTTEEMTREEFDNQIEVFKEQIKLSDGLRRLEENPDFKQIFIDIYGTEEPVRITDLLAPAHSSVSRIKPESLHFQLNAIAGFKNFCRAIHAQAESAQQSILSMQESVEEAEAYAADTQSEE